MKSKVATYAILAIIVLGGLAAFFYGVARRGRPADFTKVPLSQSEFLKDVAEPITIVESISWDGYEGSSPGITFKDASGVVRSACLADDQGIKSLTFGSLDYERGRKVPIGGPDEQAFLGLLQRWSLRDPDARVWPDRIERWLQSDRKQPLLTGDDTEGQLQALQAVANLRRLLRRN